MTDRNTPFVTALVRSLARLGVGHACITPGSRNTPLSLAFAAEDAIADWSHHDERSSAFFALGIAVTTGTPVAVVTTSGTAAAELLPAAVEAAASGVPLLLLTADRPAALFDVGAPQTVDQRDMFGRTVRWSHDLEPWEGELGRVAALAARLVAEATGARPGPVHLNLRLDEPLTPAGPPTDTAATPPIVVTAAPRVGDDRAATMAEGLAGRRGIVVAGPSRDPGLADAAAAFADAAGWPVHADALSGLRSGPHDRSRFLEAGDQLAWAGFWDAAPPEVVVRVGAVPTSKAVWQWLEAHREVPQLLIDPWGWHDPTASASTVLRADPVAALHLLAGSIETAVDPAWAERWGAADDAAVAAIGAAMASHPFPTEPAIARTVGAALPDGAVLWAASSMPVRDVDGFLAGSDRALRVMANRGANGIDGTVSTALGSAAAGGAPTYLLTGDLALLHDLTALAAAARLEVDLTVVVVDNDGGGIFHFLPQAGHEHFERHFGTPHGLDLVAAAAGLGVPADHVATAGDLTAAVATPPAGPRLLHLRTDRHDNVRVHREITDAVRQAIGIQGH